MACHKDELRLILLGKTGTGKSRTGNTILNLTHKSSDQRPFIFELKGSSVTKECDCKENEINGNNVVVIDTPGIFDTSIDKDNQQIQEEISKCIALTIPGPHAFILCIEVGRFTDEDVNTVKHFLWYFGVDILKYVVIIFTHKDKWEESYRDKNEDVPPFKTYIESLPFYPRQLLWFCNDRYVTFNNRLPPADSKNQVNTLINIVKELNVKNKKECYSNKYYVKCQEIVKSEITRQLLLVDWRSGKDIWITIFAGLRLLFCHSSPITHSLLSQDDITRMTNIKGKGKRK